eukprot:Sdes_comp21305_c0_seq1m19945
MLTDALPDNKLDVKPILKDDKEHINVKVLGQDSTEVHFKIKKNTAMGKLMDTYCSRQGLSKDSVRFMFEGTRILPQMTPKELGMDDSDVIDAFQQQQGGCSTLLLCCH